MTAGGRSKKSPFGAALRNWRHLRGRSQEQLAADAGISTRHLSFLENGRSQPSRDSVLVLGQALDLPLREQNALLEAAGFTGVFQETALDAPELQQVNRVLGWILAGCEPNGTTVLDRARNILRHNTGWQNQMTALVDLDVVFRGRSPNSLRLLFHPSGLRGVLDNWEEVARAELSRLHVEVRANAMDEAQNALLDELLAYPDVPEEWLLPAPNTPTRVVLPMQIRTPLGKAVIFSTITCIGAPRDVTLQEIRVESYAPADETSEDILARLGRGET